MKYFGALIAILGIVFSVNMINSDSALLNEANDKRESTILSSLMGIVDYLHFQPKEVNDALSDAIYMDYLDEIDGSKRFLLQVEVDELSKYREQLDNEIDRFSFKFFDLTTLMMDEAIDRSENIYRTVIDGNFDLTIDERLELDGKKKAFAQSEPELIDFWRKYIKYNVVTKLDGYQDNATLLEENSPEELEEKAVASVKELFDDWFERLQETRRSDRFDEYINTIMKQFDPHTFYFSPKEKENFDIKMGGKLEGIGARLQESGDFVKIHSIVPGGPAYKQKQLEVDDLILSVQQDGEEQVDITAMRLDDVISMIRGSKGTLVTLVVKKKSGSQESITIERDEVILDDAAAKSVILDLDEGVENIGYIHLPIFYSTFDGGKSCATDVERELEKLVGESVNGIILDLRYNGGGSLPDVITMAGLFIEEGPIVQVKSRDKKPQVHYDQDKKVTYDGPLIVLVNEISASSSEILAAALQDYGRALIVGGERTFGKASVQGVYDLDRMISDRSMMPLGQIKLTTQKFFRISGKSNQIKGVTPDVIIPDQFSYSEYGEMQYEDALSYSEIDALDYNQDVFQVNELDKLRSNSAARVQGSDNFSKVMNYGEILESQEDESEVSLSLSTYSMEAEAKEKLVEPYRDLFEADVEGLGIRNLNDDAVYINSDPSRVAKNEDFIESLKKDFYLKESLLIMRDMLEVDKRLAQK